MILGFGCNDNKEYAGIKKHLHDRFPVKREGTISYF